MDPVERVDVGISLHAANDRAAARLRDALSVAALPVNVNAPVAAVRV